MEEQKRDDLVFALDIGTRSIVGVVGVPQNGKMKVLDIEVAEHNGRTMMDGQIDNIRQVAELARTVTSRLEDRLGVSLKQVSVAAAGRSLQTQKGSFTLELPNEQVVDDELIGRLEAGAVSQAEASLQEDEKDWKQLFLVGYTVSQYRLDNYPLTVLEGHRGKKIEVDVVATFLPEEVIESLYAAMRTAGLQVASMTLEPIAAMNAAIPAELRLLNLALVDIGAGTTDIALCQGGSVVGYTMATIAGDEITETIMKACLVDFTTAEKLKRAMGSGELLSYTDILGLENRISCEELQQMVQEPMNRLAEAIAKQVLEVNTTAPSAVFLAGGGSKLHGLREKVAECLGVDEKRVAITGSNFSRSAFAENMELENPEYTTPLGIVISVGLGLLNDSYIITLNGEPAKLFRSGVLTVRDVLLMNGYTYQDMIGRTGKNLTLTLDGRRVVLRGEPSLPAVLTVNDAQASLGTVVNAGDCISFTPAQHGRDVTSTLGDFLLAQQAAAGQGDELPEHVLVNDQEADLEMQLRDRDVIQVLDSVPMPEDELAEEDDDWAEAPAVQPAYAEQREAPVVQPAYAERREIPTAQAPKDMETPGGNSVPPGISMPSGAFVDVMLNGAPLRLPPKADAQPYYLMDLLEYSGIDFAHLNRQVRLTVNGHDGEFQEGIHTGDQIEILCV